MKNQTPTEDFLLIKNTLTEVSKKLDLLFQEFINKNEYSSLDKECIDAAVAVRLSVISAEKETEKIIKKINTINQ